MHKQFGNEHKMSSQIKLLKFESSSIHYRAGLKVASSLTCIFKHISIATSIDFIPCKGV